MSKKKHKRIPHKFLPWIDARKKYKLSHEHIQMARELGMNPRKFGGMANPSDRPGYKPFPEFIASLYQERFDRPGPLEVKSIEQMAQEHMERREVRKAAKLLESANEEAESPSTEEVEVPDASSNAIATDDEAPSEDSTSN